ncbi:MAG: methyl-accepting chemotaxis protein [Turicibacter sp.]|nr:methyl-accepting chemotaxis protein [Turicibacter sp.]
MKISNLVRAFIYGSSALTFISILLFVFLGDLQTMTIMQWVSVLVALLFMLLFIGGFVVIWHNVKPLSPIGQLIQIDRLAKEAKEEKGAEPEKEGTTDPLTEKSANDVLLAIASGETDINTSKENNSAILALKYLEDMKAALEEFAKNLADGNISARPDKAKFKGNWENLVEAFVNISATLNTPVTTIKNLMTAIADGDFSYRMPELSGEYKTISDHININMDVFSSYIDEIDRVLDGIAEGNLTDKIERQYSGSLDLVKRSINSIILRLGETMRVIGFVAAGVSKSSYQLFETVKKLGYEFNNQLSFLEEITKGITQLDRQQTENTTNSRHAASLSSTAKRSAESGSTEMKKLLESMQKISESSDKISQIIKTIEDIAFQTNLLALNASVEASHAGEHGKGFAVVADQVRALSNRSSAAAKETRQLIKKSMANVEEGMKCANDTAAGLEVIVQNVSDVASVIGDIFKSSRDQTDTISNLTDAIAQLNEMIVNDVSSATKTLESTKVLDSRVIVLQEKLAFFRVKNLAGFKIKKAWAGTPLSRRDIDKFKEITGTEENFSRGDIIIQEGDVIAESMYFLLDGNVEVFLNYQEKGELMLATLQPGDIFGEMSLFLNEPRSATIVARDNVLVLNIKKRDMYDIMQKFPDVAYNITMALCSRLKNATAVEENEED